MTMPINKRRGVALLVALGVMALLVVYAVTTQTTTQMGRDHQRSSNRTLMRRAGAENLLAQAAGWRQGGMRALTLPGEPGLSADVGLRPLDSADAIYTALKGVAHLPGDALVTLRWREAPGTASAWLINQRGRRQGAIALPGPTAEKLAPAAAN
jgi:hypothetical protein